MGKSVALSSLLIVSVFLVASARPFSSTAEESSLLESLLRQGSLQEAQDTLLTEDALSSIQGLLDIVQTQDELVTDQALISDRTKQDLLRAAFQGTRNQQQKAEEEEEEEEEEEWAEFQPIDYKSVVRAKLDDSAHRQTLFQSQVISPETRKLILDSARKYGPKIIRGVVKYGPTAVSLLGLLG